MEFYHAVGAVCNGSANDITLNISVRSGKLLPTSFIRNANSLGSMRPINVALLVFLVSLVAYGWIGFLWVLFDLSFISGSGALATEASKIQTVAFLSLFGALLTSI